MTTIAITGASGLVGRRLATALEARSDVTRIVGLDRRIPHGMSSPRFVHRPADITSPAIEAALTGVDVVVHLASRFDPMHDEAAMRAINVDGARNLVLAAEQAGVGHVVLLSSAAVYGAYADNDLPLTEASPLRGTPGLPFSEHQRDVELWLAERQREGHHRDVAVLRSALVLGNGVDNVATRLLEAPRITMVRGHEPPLQFIHLDDLVAAIVHVIDRRLTGPYNVAAEGWLAFDDVLEVVGKRAIAIPEELAYTTAERLWKLGIGEYPPGLVAHLMHPWVMSPAELIATGWQPQVTNRAALAETAADHAGHVAAMGVRTRWSTVRWAAVGLAATSTLLAFLLLRAARRAWRRHRGGGAEGGTDGV